MLTHKYLKGYGRLTIFIAIIFALIGVSCYGISTGCSVFVATIFLSLIAYCMGFILLAIFLWIWDGFRNGDTEEKV